MDYSVFMWNDDTPRKHIYHHPTCFIPLVPSNENEDVFSTFVDSNSKYVIDEKC